MKGFVLSLVIFCCTACSTTTRVFVEHAQLVDDPKGIAAQARAPDVRGQRAGPVRLLLNGHHVQSGRNVVLMIRAFDRGELFGVDHDAFEKLTVEIAEQDEGKLLFLDSPNVRIYYSRAGCLSAATGLGVYGSRGHGTIFVQPSDTDQLSLSIDVSIELNSARTDVPLREARHEVKGSYTLKRISLERITPWLGAPGWSIEEEVVP
ncbi:MAG: hypothetical protein ACHQ4J_08250 [Candidatus Binatia bacterium]